MAIIRTLKDEKKGEKEILIREVADEIDLDELARKILSLFRESGLSPLPIYEVTEFLEKAVQNHNQMTEIIGAFLEGPTDVFLEGPLSVVP